MRIRRRPRALLLLGLAASLQAPPAHAARLPDWAKEIADAAPPAPEGVPPYPSRVLLSETRHAVQADGTVRILRRFAAQALSTRADEIGTGHFVFHDTMKVTSSRAWHVPPGERASRSWGAPADVALNDAFLSETKARVVRVKGIRKGSLVFYEFEATDRPRLLPISDSFYEGSPVAVERMELEAPAGWTIQWAWLRGKGPDPVVDGNLWTWEMRDLPAPEEEPLSAPPAERAPLLLVNPVPAPGVSIEAASFADWASFSRWYDDLIKGRHEATPAITAAVKKAAGDAASGFFPKVKAAGVFVRDKVRYVDVELGIGGMQPRPASDTLANLYGDCKDKGTLFRSLLAEEGLASYPVLINLLQKETVSEQVPGWGFNHFVVAVPVPADETIPEAFAPAIVDAGELGRLLIVDTTDERTAIGSLSANLAGKRGLVVAGERGRLITLPSGDPSAHTLVRRLLMEVHPGRSVEVVRESRYTGSFAARARASYSTSSIERRKGVEQRIVQIWPDAAVEEYQAEYETPDGAFVEKVKLKLRPLASTGPGARLEIFPGAAEDLERVPLGRRRTAVDYDHAQTIRYEVTLKGIPESTQLPSPQSSQGDGWAVTTSYAREGETIHAAWEVVLSRTRFVAEAFADLRKFWSAMASAASWALNLPF